MLKTDECSPTPKSSRKKSTGSKQRSSIDKYKTVKKKVLKELGIHLTDKEIAHLDSLETENQIDNFARKLIMR